jgi:hypothetical protein
MLYAYWERFFRIAFAEFLRCLTLARVDIEQINTPLARFRIARELGNFLAAHNISTLSELAGAHPPASLRPLLKDLHDFLLRPIEFAAPTDWIKTYANVRFRVLEEHCDKFGLEMNRLTQEFTSKSLFQGLNELVDQRNDVAHGKSFTPVLSPEWEQLKTFVYKVMQVVQFELHELLTDEARLLAPQAVITPEYDI